MKNKNKILKLFNIVLSNLRNANRTIITESYSKDEKKELEAVDIEIAEYENNFKELLSSTSKKKMFFLFMNHKSGDHGLSAHPTLQKLKDEVQSVVDLIKDDATEEQHEENCKIIESITGDGDFYELTDSTWFDVFEIEV